MSKPQKSATARVIAVLAVLLCLSLLALAVVAVIGHRQSRAEITVTVPNNRVTPVSGEIASPTTVSTVAPSDRVTASPEDSTTVKAAVLQLHQQRPQDNAAFSAANLLPGDCVEQYYCVKASYRQSLTVNFQAQVRAGSSPLDAVMKIRVALPMTGDVLYDGLLSAMPPAVSCLRETEGETTEELYYAIAVYLDTSVGNEYQEQSLVADFYWWGAETEQLLPPAATGVAEPIIFWAILVLTSGIGCVVLAWVVRRKGENA